MTWNVVDCLTLTWLLFSWFCINTNLYLSVSWKISKAACKYDKHCREIFCMKLHNFFYTFWSKLCWHTDRYWHVVAVVREKIPIPLPFWVSNPGFRWRYVSTFHSQLSFWYQIFPTIAGALWSLSSEQTLRSHSSSKGSTQPTRKLNM